MISLVTACMNREAHLRESLPHWLGLPGITEIVVVDWSNAKPLRELTKLDPRVRVIRVEGEPRWILSYAYNLGVARSTGTIVLKSDADCLPQAAVTGLVSGPAHFFAGYWQSGSQVGKPSVNGQCLFARSQFDAINGYSEYIRTYGRDDEDFYARLTAAGFERREISPADLNFIDHSHEARMACKVDPAEMGVEGWLHRNVVFNEMHNACVARLLPWSRQCAAARFRTTAMDGAWEVVRRDPASELPVPREAAVAARLFALRYIVKQVQGPAASPAAQPDERACLEFLIQRFGAKPKLVPSPLPGLAASVAS